MQAVLEALQPWHLASIAIALVLFAQIVQTRYRTGLRQIPGPLLASLSNLDRMWSCARGRQMEYHLKLHEKYGTYVRIGPNHISISDASLIPLIYGITTKFYKSDFYVPFDVHTPAGDLPSVFSVRDNAQHKAIRRPIAQAYSMGTMKELEPMNDVCSSILLRKLEGLVGQDIALGDWVHWYAFDVITSITFSNRIGFMEQERDVDNIIAALEGRQKYNSTIGQAPWLHALLLGNSIGRRIANIIPATAIMNSARYIVSFAVKQIERYQSGKTNTVELVDLLDRFKRHKDGDTPMSNLDLLLNASGLIFAGADTTAISLRAIFYYLCRNPTAHAKLLAEIDAADAVGQLSDPVTFAEAQGLEYFQAVVKEALRMHPAVGMLLERVVPGDGAEVGGVWLPGGTIVGVNPWVAARDKGVYGDDAYNFRPERWLEADEKQLKIMDRNFLAFGAGSRTCLGKNISLLEMSKLVPEVFRHFDFELSHPEKEWELHDYWFVKQTGVTTKVKKRHV